jgi:putative ABC transport system permease protein
MAMLLFMLLPIMNLLNINISRILDRSSEIGVRKSFGATSGHLVRQFIVENLVVTGLGGLLGFVLAILTLALIAGTGLLPNESFQFNYRVIALGLLYVLVFGVLSAAYPAWKMSRLDPVHALKGAVS